MEPTEPNLLRATALIPRVISSFIWSERPQVTSKHVRWGVAHELGLNVRSFDGVPWKGRLKDATIAYLQSNPDQVEPEEPPNAPNDKYDGVRRTIAELNLLSAQPLSATSSNATPAPELSAQPSITRGAALARSLNQQQQSVRPDPLASTTAARRSLPAGRPRTLPPSAATATAAGVKRPLPSSPASATSSSRRHNGPPAAKAKRTSAGGPSKKMREAHYSSEEDVSEPENEDSGDDYRSEESASADEDDDGSVRGQSSSSGTTRKGKARLSSADAKAAEHVEDLKDVYKALGHNRTKWETRFRHFPDDFHRQAEYISRLCKEEGMTEPFSISQARNVKSERQRVEFEDRREQYGQKTLRGRNGRLSSTTSEQQHTPMHGRLTRGTAPPVANKAAAPRIVRTEKVGGASWAYVEIDDGVPLTGPAQPANMQAVLGFLGGKE